MIELKQEGYGEIELFQSIPVDLKNLNKFLIDPSAPIIMKGEKFKGMMQAFSSKGFVAWYTQAWAAKPTVLNGRAEMSMLELRIALKNTVRGKWDKIVDAELEPNYFQMGYVPFVITRAVFEVPVEYQTFDIHFELSYLLEFGLDFKTLDKFINKVSNEQPAELSRFAHPCPPIMMDAVYNILDNSYSPAGKARLLKDCVNQILLAALETVGKEEIKNLPLSAKDIDGLHRVREEIDLKCPDYPGNDELVEIGQLNAFKLSYGFKRVFGINPHDYYLQRRFIMAKKLLRENDNSVSSVAYELRYQSPGAFIRAFKSRFRYTPKHFQKYGE